jgi:hypothetical protein
MPIYKLTPRPERLADPRWRERTRLWQRCWVQAPSENAARYFVAGATISANKYPPTYHPEPSPWQDSEFTDYIEEDRPGGNPTGHQILTDDREFM